MQTSSEIFGAYKTASQIRHVTCHFPISQERESEVLCISAQQNSFSGYELKFPVLICITY